MSILTLLVTLVLIGCVTWLLVTYVPMVQPIKNLIVIVASVIALVIVLQAFGLIGGLASVKVPSARG